MKRLVEFALSDMEGDSIWIEVDEVEDEAGAVQAGRLGDAVEKIKSKISFDAALHQVCTATERVVKQLRSLSDQPDEVGVEFGFNLHWEVGASIGAKASSDCNYKVTMKWQKKSPKTVDAS